MRPYLEKNPRQNRAGRMVQAVESLPSKWEALSSLSTNKKKKKKKGKAKS
jgi:hypothetical protein